MATRGRKVTLDCKCGGTFAIGSEDENGKVILTCDKCKKTKEVLVEKLPNTPVLDSEEECN